MKIDSQSIEKIVKDNSFSVVKLKKEIERVSELKVELEEKVVELKGKLGQSVDNEGLFEKVCKTHLECVLNSTFSEED